MHRFRSRVSIVLLAVIAASVLPVVFLNDSIDPNEVYLAYGILGITIGFVFLLLFSTEYEISETHLAIKIGPVLFGKIKVSDIELVERSYNPLSSPASSLKRLLISSKNRNMLISPANEKEFVRLLQARNPNIQIDITDKNGWWRFWDWDI